MERTIFADAAGEWRTLFAGAEYEWIRTSQLAPTRGEGGVLHFMDRDDREGCIAAGKIRPEDALEW